MSDLWSEASELDRAYGMAPDDPAICARRADVLDRLCVTEHGITFRAIPTGAFHMGSDTGDPDERPVHQVMVPGFWLSETTISWGLYQRLMGWDGSGFPPKAEGVIDRSMLSHLHQANKIRLQYCEDETVRARDWHAHARLALQGESGAIPATALFGHPLRNNACDYSYSRKPMVAVAWQEAEELCEKLSTPSVLYRLPTEAEWEKGARGGLVGCSYAWGDDPPTADRCDFDRFDKFSVRPFRSYPPNGYGLYAMCGSVWEWTSDQYDALAYAGNRGSNDPPSDPASGSERVLRGGSWADGAEAVTVSFRMSRDSSSWRAGTWAASLCPNIGFRVARIDR